MRSAGGPEWLPSDGRLLFFYEFDHGSWGIYPEDAGSAVVVHETGPAPEATEPDDLKDYARFPAYPVTFGSGVSYPSEERVSIGWRKLGKAETDAFYAALEELAPPAPTHQIGGYPQPVQNDEMEAECQAATAGLRRIAKKKVSGVEDWRLLLQLDTDDSAGMMWGDVGMLYFWIREQDARAGDFSRVWMILQCC